MPRSGYDLTGAAQGSPASEAAARARQRADTASRTPRAGTPTNPSRQDGDDQEITPRASRIGVFAGTAPANFQTSFQMGFIPQRMERPELYQNPLNMSSAQNASQSLMMPVNPQYGFRIPPGAQSTVFSRVAIPVSTSQDMGFINAQAPFGASSRQPIDSGAANSRVEQHLFQRSGGRFHAMPVIQHGFPTHHNSDPNAQSPFYSSHSQTGTGPSDTVDEDAEMTDVDGQRDK
ncbi:hypothetical protein ACSS6W_002756 [Trichoderma asperelloides]|uniref:Uncharacterized protein n=1 Tax=Trichoderma asperellum TaxID=101201 RepID=A0A6V8QR69_TRIAP|nr:hypothetical protein LI328DRAFT_159055 [Trichoderma asperelloides]GFP54865.1 hypothetical protein TASIC1_0004049000 [Trichoderma asperellum]